MSNPPHQAGAEVLLVDRPAGAAAFRRSRRLTSPRTQLLPLVGAADMPHRAEVIERCTFDASDDVVQATLVEALRALHRGDGVIVHAEIVPVIRTIFARLVCSGVHPVRRDAVSAAWRREIAALYVEGLALLHARDLEQFSPEIRTNSIRAALEDLFEEAPIPT